jgi:hypothetical protein
VGRSTDVESFVGAVVEQARASLLWRLGSTLDGLVLAGGFGRGEGGGILRPDGTRLLNDLDLYLFFRGRPGAVLEHVKGVRAELANASAGIRFKEIDIVARPRWRSVVQRSRTVESYELAEGARTVHGTGFHRRLGSSAALPLYEGTNYLRNRTCGVLIALLFEFVGAHQQMGYRELSHFELQKGLIAVGDARLIEQRRYHWSYAERMRRIGLLEPEDSATAGFDAQTRFQCARAYEEKMSTEQVCPDPEAVMSRLHTVRRILGSFFLRYEERRLRRRFGAWSEYASSVSRHAARVPFRQALKDGLVSISDWRSRAASKGAPRFTATHQAQLAAIPHLVFGLSDDLAIDRSCVSALSDWGWCRADDRPETLARAWVLAASEFLASYHSGGIAAIAVRAARDWLDQHQIRPAYE